MVKEKFCVINLILLGFIERFFGLRMKNINKFSNGFRFQVNKLIVRRYFFFRKSKFYLCYSEHDYCCSVSQIAFFFQFALLLDSWIGS